jgi:YesN/AraC family two-component response regulator
MRRTHPHCVNFILTAYPALEAALDAIRNQVDRFMVKPADVSELLGTIEQELREHPSHQPSVPRRLSQVLRESAYEIANRTLAGMKASQELLALPLSDKERISLIPAIVQNLAALVEKSGAEAEQALVSMAEEQAMIRHGQGYTAPMLMENVRIVGDSIAEIVRENMLSMDMSSLWADIQRLNDWGTLHIKELLKAYYRAEERVA